MILHNATDTIEILDPYVPLPSISIPKKYKNQVKEERNNKLLEIERNHREKAGYIVSKYLSKLNNTIVWTISTRNDIPKQMNDWDCGVFMLEFIKYSILDKKFDFGTSDMMFFRETIKKEIQQKLIIGEVNVEKDTISVSSSSRSSFEKSIEDLIQNEDTENDTRTNSTQGNIQKPPRFQNECGTICWLNSLVQLLLLTINVEDTHSFLKSIFEQLKMDQKSNQHNVCEIIYWDSCQNLKMDSKTHSTSL